MKRSSYSICFTGLMLLAVVVLTAGCSQLGERVSVSDEESVEVSSQEPIDAKPIMLPGDVPLEMVWIPPGNFMMGSPEDEQDHYEREGPQREVTIAEGFWMGKYTITQAQWEAVVGSNPSVHSGPNRPIDRVFWNDIRERDGFLDRLNALNPHYKFRLPSEAEWEYAARAGMTTRFYWGDDPDYTYIDNYAWSGGNHLHPIHPVGQKFPNAWGLYDMSGNVWEWCEDDYHANYIGAPTDGSAWVDEPRGSDRVLRGGSYSSGAAFCRSAYRHNAHAYRFAGRSWHRTGDGFSINPDTTGIRRSFRVVWMP